ncbi:MAG: deoxyguanosinetriphosphate triphosphohydrolase [Oscillospiraceae bacterium]|nr:deoxyguanosinetriphosphate triphosphohydrolase [Oscillospiraceae bacterium]
MTVREMTEKIERETLSPRAALAGESGGRQISEEPCPIRTCYQRDRDRIIHSKAFRRLKHKTQVFLQPEGDHYRTRLTHTLEVSQIARTVARALRLNEDLTEAVALGHDLGHTPFGHAGERALNAAAKSGFTHYEQSLRVADRLENLNLTLEVRDGILHHTKDELPRTLEGQIVRVSDRVAYMNHDIDDSIRAGILTARDLPEEVLRVLGERHSQRIGRMINSIINMGQRGEIRMESEVQAAADTLREFLFARVYRDSAAKAEEHKAESLVTSLFQYYMDHIERLPREYQATVRDEGGERAVLDYIAGMSDRFAVAEFTRLNVPSNWKD